MKSIGIVRKVDKLHRYVIPQEICDTYGIQEGTPMEVFIDGDNIILRKYQTGCIFCDSMDGLKEFGGQYICEHCREQIRKGLKE